MSTYASATLHERVLHLEMRRPESNLLGSELIRELRQYLHEANLDPRVGCILLSAQGSLFCSGVDYGEVAGWSEQDWEQAEEVLTAMRWLRKPLVGSVQGPALGTGVTLIANTHVAVAAQGSSFALTDIRVGAWPSLGFDVLSASIGERRALSLAVTGRQFSVQEALQFGLIDEIAPAIEVEDRAEAIAEHLASLRPDALLFGLRQHAVGETSLAHFRKLLESPELEEGLAASRERRKAQWNRSGSDL